MLHKSRIWSFLFTTPSLHLKQYLPLFKSSINICWMNRWENVHKGHSHKNYRRTHTHTCIFQMQIHPLHPLAHLWSSTFVVNNLYPLTLSTDFRRVHILFWSFIYSFTFIISYSTEHTWLETHIVLLIPIFNTHTTTKPRDTYKLHTMYTYTYT